MYHWYEILNRIIFIDCKMVSGVKERGADTTQQSTQSLPALQLSPLHGGQQHFYAETVP